MVHATVRHLNDDQRHCPEMPVRGFFILRLKADVDL
jgi:hypothetical protein